jgi:hypothetical protein
MAAGYTKLKIDRTEQTRTGNILCAVGFFEITCGPSYQETPKMNELDIVGKEKMPRRANFAKF